MQKLFFITIFCALFSVVPLFAQVENENHGVIYIKLGNLLRRGHQHTLAEYYIKKGLPLVKGKDKFWEASGYEALGLVYKNIGVEELSQKFFLDALNLYVAEKNVLAEKALSDILEGDTPNAALFSDVKVPTPAHPRDAFILMKTGSVLIEAKQYDLAQACIEKALVYAKDKNLYWEATAYEYLGMLGWDKNNNQMAAQYYNMAQSRFEKNKNFISAALVRHLLKAVQETEEIYGGIEVGAKGIKANVIGIILTKKGDYKVKVKYTEVDNNTNLSILHTGDMLAADKLDKTANTVKFYYDKLMAEQGVAADKIFVVASSSVAAAKNAEALRKKILAAFTVADISPTVNFTTTEKETEYDILGVVPDNKLFQSAVIDVGSGNTEVGCLLPEGEKRVNYFAVPYGAENLRALVKEEQKKGGDFNNLAKTTIRTKVEPEITAYIEKSAALKSRKEIYLLGGAAWALVTYLYPQQADQAMITLTTADIGKFRDMSTLLYDKLTNPDLSKITDAAVKQKATADIQQVKEVFDKESLATGALLLATAANNLNGTATDKKFIFARSGLSAWISGYAVQYITDGYKKLKEVEE
jgi:tetratricopeptide (TPR) repeat protein